MANDINKIAKILKSPQYTSKEYLEYFLEEKIGLAKRYGRLRCNRADHGPNVDIKFTKKGSKNYCGCFACGIMAANPIDCVLEFHPEMLKVSVPENEKNKTLFVPAVILAAELTGVISKEEADALRKGANINLSKLDEVEQKVVKVKKISYSYDKVSYDFDKANIIYTALGNLNEICGRPRLLPHHYNELLNKRRLSDEEIKEIGFFTWPNCSIEFLINEIKQYGLSEEDLQYIPGFFYDKKNECWDFMSNNDSAYAIPIRDYKNRIIALQLRHTGENVSLRYTWMSSKSAMENINNPKAKTTYGNTCGTPFAVIRPKTLRNNSVLITEGFFKAYTFSRTYGCVCIAVQGVQNIAGINDVLDELRKEGLCSNIMIGYDADMAVNENVLKPALKLACLINNANEDIMSDLQNLCANGNKSEKLLAKNLTKEYTTLSSFFNGLNNLYFITWNMDIAKGVDDLINAGYSNKIHYIKSGVFFQKAYNVMVNIDNLKWEQHLATKERFVSIKVDETILKKFFFDIVLTA